ncbi:MAG: cytochrome d ubiquinol oxidase subunit II [Porticoccaceae bacterium]|nr:cytochrome d ubiquinol oxidase subunit II [Porticoccaceae bacterium]
MEYWLPLFFVFVIGFCLLVYVVLDGFDLGIGLLLPFASDQEKDTMVASIGPFWDANETWIVLGVGVLLIAFPSAYGLVLSSLYVPVTLMLMGLILRGVAFDFRVKAGDQHKSMWNKAFFIGSLIAAVSQGWMLGAYITGLLPGMIHTLFSALIALTLPALYIMLGSAWLMMKTEDELFTKAVRWAKQAILPMGIALFMVSIATPTVSDEIARKWFSLPNAIGLLPIPLASIIAYVTIYYLLGRLDILKAGYAWLIFAGLILICVMAALGLAYSIFPDIVIGQINIWSAASATKSLQFVFVGLVITLPVIIGYTIFIYRIFHGKATSLSYD